MEITMQIGEHIVPLVVMRAAVSSRGRPYLVTRGRTPYYGISANIFKLSPSPSPSPEEEKGKVDSDPKALKAFGLETE